MKYLVFERGGRRVLEAFSESRRKRRAIERALAAEGRRVSGRQWVRVRKALARAARV